MKTFITGLTFVLSSLLLNAQTVPHGWYLLDKQQDGYYGISLAKAYSLLKGKPSTTVIVAVIDSGIDTLQEDLKPILWTNSKEIPFNGKDDDGNGYIDDVHGWNFDGSPSGENLVRNSHEVERVYHTWKTEFEGRAESTIPSDKKFLYSQWVKARDIIEKDFTDASLQKPEVDQFMNAILPSSDALNKALGKESFKKTDIRDLKNSTDKSISRAASVWMEVFTRNPDSNLTSRAVIDDVKRFQDDLNNKIDRKLNPPVDLRGELTHDKPTDINDKFYGNNNLKTGSGDHGSMVAGIIGAVRNNSIGIDGIADNVRIMAIRAMPGGDEHDKDVALAIRYAVDNGASIINMSFGKPVSPYKQFVDDAVKYASSKGVLLVHASGNDGKNITKDIFYPNQIYLNRQRATNFIAVGASGDPALGNLAAPFSNYSSEWVDIFAPGMEIYSTATDNRYVSASGTSVAAPVVSGVAALLKSYFPSLTPDQIISILTKSGTPIELKVVEPGTDNEMVKFSSLSTSGRIVNAYEAVKMAQALKK